MIKAESLEAVHTHTHTHTNSLRNGKGITLVALVVTIVVLLILAGVSINLVLGENGLITQAKEAREQTKTAEVNEKSQMDSASDFISEAVNDTELPQTNETKPYMPGDGFTKVEGTNLANGLTIQDSDGNQYVWVEVPKKVTVYPIAGLNITEFTIDDYIKIEDDLHQYTMSYRKGNKDTETAYKDEYIDGSDNPEFWFNGEEEYNKQKQRMLKSVYENGGFWVGRYEAGIEQIRMAKSEEIKYIPQSKKDLYPYTYITRAQAKVLSEKIKYGEYVGSLMFGVQWDLVLAFMHNKGKVSEDSINKDSKNIGNYWDAQYTLNTGRYARLNELSKWYNYTENLNEIVENCTKKAQNLQENAVLLTTGAATENSIMNIYDIAGNQWEWTLESATASDRGYCASRGGSFGDYGARYPASYRYGDNKTYSSETVTFRVSIY